MLMNFCIVVCYCYPHNHISCFRTKLIPLYHIPKPITIEKEALSLINVITPPELCPFTLEIHLRCLFYYSHYLLFGTSLKYLSNTSLSIAILLNLSILTDSALLPFNICSIIPGVIFFWFLYNSFSSQAVFWNIVFIPVRDIHSYSFFEHQ